MYRRCSTEVREREQGKKRSCRPVIFPSNGCEWDVVMDRTYTRSRASSYNAPDDWCFSFFFKATAAATAAGAGCAFALLIIFPFPSRQQCIYRYTRDEARLFEFQRRGAAASERGVRVLCRQFRNYMLDWSAKIAAVKLGRFGIYYGNVFSLVGV